jgi:hypothetical protein
MHWRCGSQHSRFDVLSMGRKRKQDNLKPGQAGNCAAPETRCASADPFNGTTPSTFSL